MLDKRVKQLDRKGHGKTARRTTVYGLPLAHNKEFFICVESTLATRQKIVILHIAIVEEVNFYLSEFSKTQDYSKRELDIANPQDSIPRIALLEALALTYIHMDAWVPQCKPLKEQYDVCMQNVKLVNLSFGGVHVCTDKFEDYKDCVTIGMKMRNTIAAEARRVPEHTNQSDN